MYLWVLPCHDYLQQITSNRGSAWKINLLWLIWSSADIDNKNGFKKKMVFGEDWLFSYSQQSSNQLTRMVFGEEWHFSYSQQSSNQLTKRITWYSALSTLGFFTIVFCATKKYVDQLLTPKENRHLYFNLSEIGKTNHQVKFVKGIIGILFLAILLKMKLPVINT